MTMPRIILTATTLVLACDGRRARFLGNVGDALRPQLVLIEEMESPANPRAADQGSDRPGRMSTPRGPRSAMEENDWHERGEEAFVASVAARLAALAEAREANAIIICAAPRALAVLREELPQNLRALIKAELDKDYTRTPAHELARLLLAA
jgi:protein required for attachment to host cells